LGWGQTNYELSITNYARIVRIPAGCIRTGCKNGGACPGSTKRRIPPECETMNNAARQFAFHGAKKKKLSKKN
jgi:hypothetical protein